jgi:hypothetical protein
MRWLILTAASVFHIEEPVGSYDCFGHFILLTGRGKVPPNPRSGYAFGQLTSTRRD